MSRRSRFRAFKCRMHVHRPFSIVKTVWEQCRDCGAMRRTDKPNEKWRCEFHYVPTIPGPVIGRADMITDKLLLDLKTTSPQRKRFES